MITKRRIKLLDYNYFICCECKYNQKDNDINLELKNYKDKYYDDGDLTLLIEKIEKNYNKFTYKKYDDRRWFLSDCLYIYDNIPFISSVGYYTLSPVDGGITSASYIAREELDEYIKNNNIKMNDKNKFKLWDGRTWNFKE